MMRLGRLAAVAARAARTARPSSVSASLPAACRFSTNSHDVMNVHWNEPGNDWQATFDFTPSNYEIVSTILKRYPDNYQASAMIPLLDLAQQQNGGWLTLAAMNRVADVLKVAPIRVYEVASFYSMFNRTKVGRFHIQVCGTTPCMLQGSKKIRQAVVDRLGVDFGETTEDGLFTVSEMECMGACVNAPMIAIADYSNGVEGFSYTYYEDLTPEDVNAIIDDLVAGRKPRANSQHRRGPIPAGAVVDGERWVDDAPSTTTLMGEPRGPYCRDLNPPKPEEEAAPAAAK